MDDFGFRLGSAVTTLAFNSESAELPQVTIRPDPRSSAMLSGLRAVISLTFPLSFSGSAVATTATALRSGLSWVLMSASTTFGGSVGWV